MKKILKRCFYTLLILVLIVTFCGLTFAMSVVNTGEDYIAATIDSSEDVLSEEEIEKLKALDAQCVLVLGCGILDENTPSPMLKDRLDAAIQVYKSGAAPKILASGDNGSEGHNEIHVMLLYLKNAGIPEEDIFCDHAGFSTYDSVYRAGDIFQVERMIVVTQSYHLYRALYLAKEMDYQVLGVAANQETYRGQFAREAREILARIKDYFKVMLGKPAAYSGEEIPITGSGLVSHGE